MYHLVPQNPQNNNSKRQGRPHASTLEIKFPTDSKSLAHQVQKTPGTVPGTRSITKWSTTTTVSVNSTVKLRSLRKELERSPMPNPTSSDPFPWLPMLAIATGLVSHSYALSSLFPYIGYMVQYLGVTDDKDEAGFYAGYVSSALMVGRFGSSYFWGRFADRYGRLPVMYISLCSMAVLAIAFGFSTSFYWAVACRFLLGAMNGLVATSKTMISEVCTKTHEVVGMGAITACWSLGLVGGPGLGGLLSEPAKHYPRFFSESGLFGRFPYLLPNVVGACIALAGIPMVFFFLPETKPTPQRNGGDRNGFKPLSTLEPDLEDSDVKDGGANVEMIPLTQAKSLDYGQGNDEDDISLGKHVSTSSNGSSRTVAENSHDFRGTGIYQPCKDKKRVDSRGRYETVLGHRASLLELSSADGGFDDLDVGAGKEGVLSACWAEFLVPMRLLAERKVRGIIFVYGLISFTKIGIDEVYPLWALSTAASGGLDWTTKDIGKCLCITGLAVLVFQLVVYPRMIKVMGMQCSQRIGSLVGVPVFLAIPLLSLLHDAGWVLVAANLVVLFAINITANMIFISIALATNNAVDRSRRGALNGVSMTVGSLAKAAGPTGFAIVFAWSINRPRVFPFDYQLAFYVMALLMAVTTVAGWDVIHPPEAVESEATVELTERPGARKVIHKSTLPSSHSVN
ncbi:unnamed protein product [Ascophyllum nodosum]